MRNIRDPLLADESLSVQRSYSDHTDTAAGYEDKELDAEERAYLRRRFQNPNWTLDRGVGYYEEERQRRKRPALVQTGRHAGRSRVKIQGIEWRRILHHILKRDFFNAAVNAKLPFILLALFIVYWATLTVWAVAYYLVWRFHKHCFSGFNGPVSAFMFSVETQQTIGYGVRAPGDCWITAVMIAIHSILTVLLDSIILGIAFARISHPKNRGRTILISDSAVMARRDGQLKFMFRVADIQKRQVVHPSVKAFLYTWGEGRLTAEGEYLPVRVQELRIDYWDKTLLLPVIVEHTIDERSPLYGHTQKSLERLGAEIIVELEGSTELGDSFMVRQSYLPQEIHFGHVFARIIKPAPEGETQHIVDIARFHDVEPQPGLDALPPQKLAVKVVAGGQRTVPAPLLQENTLVLSDEMVVCPRDGKLYLMVRIGDTYPSQALDVRVSAYIYRYSPHVTQEGEVLAFSVEELPMLPNVVVLRYPMVVSHEINEQSPIWAWRTPEGKRAESDAEVLVVLRGLFYSTNSIMMRSKVYPALGSIRYGHLFLPAVVPAARGSRAGAQINWANFHTNVPCQSAGAKAMSRPSSYTNLLALAGAGAVPSPPASPAVPVAANTAAAAILSAANDTSHELSFAPGPHADMGRRRNGPAVAAAAPQAAGVAARLHEGGDSMRHRGAAGELGQGQQSVAQFESGSSSRPSTPIPSATGMSPDISTERSHFGTDGNESWKQTRSLFTALEELRKYNTAMQEPDSAV